MYKNILGEISQYLICKNSANFVVSSLFFQIFAVWGPKLKTLILAILNFQPVIARQLKPFIQRCDKVFTGRSLGNYTVPVIYYFIFLFYFIFCYVKL